MFMKTRQEQNDIFNKLSVLQIHFIRYLQVGGFPELALSSDDIYAQRILREDITVSSRQTARSAESLAMP